MQAIVKSAADKERLAGESASWQMYALEILSGDGAHDSRLK